MYEICMHLCTDYHSKYAKYLNKNACKLYLFSLKIYSLINN